VGVGRTLDARRVGVRDDDDARLRRRHPADELVVDLDVRGALVRPTERALDPGAADLAHRPPPRRVVEELEDGPRVAVDVAVRHVDRGILGRNPGLLEVERDDRQPEGHVLERLVHGGDVVERVARVRRQPEVSGGEDVEDRLVRHPSRKLDVVPQTELVAQGDEVGVTVAAAHEREGHVGPSEHVDDVMGGADGEVDAVLRTHDPEVGDEVAAAAPELGDRRTAPQLDRVRPGADDGDVVAGLAAAIDRDLRVGAVGRHDVVGRPERGPFERDETAAREPGSAREARVEELGAQVVVVEDELGAVPRAQPPRDRPEDVRGVARLQHV